MTVAAFAALRVGRRAVVADFDAALDRDADLREDALAM